LGHVLAAQRESRFLWTTCVRAANAWFNIPLAFDASGPYQPTEIANKIAAALPIAVPPRPTVDHIPTITTLAPESRSTSKAEVPPTPLELRVGKAVAMTASAIAQGVCDFGKGGKMTVATKKRVASLFGELYEARSLMMSNNWDFDGIAHQLGRQWLIEACSPANDGERAIVDTLINTVVLILRKVALSQTN
jgi:hypothetical protein